MSTLSDDLHTLSYEAYLYFYPLVTMEVTRLQSLNSAPGAKPGFGPPNRFSHLRAFPSADFRAVVRPNFDTLYSIAWLDLTNGPIRLQAADTGNRYYMLPMLDMWTDVFANPGTRTTGSGPLDLVIAGPGQAGKAPPGATVVVAPTPYAWLIGRTQTNGPADYPAVHEVQDGYLITDLGSGSEFVADPDHDVATEPSKIVNGMAALDFFAYAADLLRVNPPHPTDFSILARLAGLGIEPGKPFQVDRFNAGQIAEIKQGRQRAIADMSAGALRLGSSVNGWMTLTESMGVYGNNYFRRAVTALIGLGANPAEDAVYPMLTADADGAPVVGEHDYVLHFGAGGLPPVNAFWSVTMYDAAGFPVANELNRFAIGDRDALRRNPDGSLDIYIQHRNPGPERESNWLPAPLGPLGITMRLYAPKPEVVAGAWAPPGVRRV
ncbi:DUF1254 domain-containing protein [Mycobacterium angelicum]|uniref:DUF1254 domain-containing protein n=1 Tax=Mycobacterium angelicum TaxID=470074 RepID=A0A1X0A7W3_MYCAN|nr:DUF1254 domain-containing protein [Mycobacterium angelicum]MCV7194925.1 DUF1254 domain-containing protein [Mycobacterium angelicum]ORA25766.1 hypothetical protein BST12_01590 [Mycobacterium angelicum]